MKLFVWQNLVKVSDNYHCNGGLLVVAKDFDDALVKANAVLGVTVTKDDIPDLVLEVFADQPEVMVFPNAGCCC